MTDDIAMGITLVMRGDDHISNTPKQILLYRALGPSSEVRALADDSRHGRQEAQQRHGATAVGDYQHLGILPRRCSISSRCSAGRRATNREIMSRSQMIELFSLEGLQKNAAIFDTKKLEWMNGQHLSALPAAELLPASTRARPNGGRLGGA